MRLEQTRFHWTDLDEICHLGFFENLLRKLKLHENLTNITSSLYEDVFTFMTVSRWVLFRLRNILDKVVEKIKTHILCSVTFFRKSCCLWDNVEKIWRNQRGHGWRYKMEHGFTTRARTQIVCKTYCFSTATMVSRTRMSVTLYAHRLSS
jgi:hypothetical protein